MACVIKNNIFASDMSVFNEYISLISYNFRKLRHINNQSIDFISEKTGIDTQVLARLENEKNCGLSTAIGIAIHFKITLNDLIKERDYNKDEIFALKKREVPAQLEKYDGFKHIDIAVPEAKINIEVDGIHHNFNSTQALRDLKRTYHSFLKGYYTLRIPNSLVRNDSFLDETANFIVKILNENYDNINKKNFYDQ